MLDPVVEARIRKAASFEEPDRVPTWHAYIRNDAVFDYYAPDETDVLERTKAFYEAIENDVGGTISGADSRQDGSTRRRECGGRDDVQVSGYTSWHLRRQIESIEELRAFEYDPPSKEQIRQSWAPQTRRVKEALEPRTLYVPGIMMAMHAPCHTWMGSRLFCEAIYDAPEDLDRLMRQVQVGVVRQAEVAAESGLTPFIWFADDLGGKGSTIFSPEWLRAHYWPLVEEVAAPLRAAGITIIHDLDGYVMPLIDDLLAVGCQGLAWIDIASGMDLAALKRRYDGRLILVGGIPSALFTYGTPEDIRRVTREAIGTAAPGGGYFICCDGDVDPLAKLENFQAFIEAIEEYGSYPIRC